MSIHVSSNVNRYNRLKVLWQWLLGKLCKNPKILNSEFATLVKIQLKLLWKIFQNFSTKKFQDGIIFGIFVVPPLHCYRKMNFSSNFLFQHAAASFVTRLIIFIKPLLLRFQNPSSYFRRPEQQIYSFPPI